MPAGARIALGWALRATALSLGGALFLVGLATVVSHLTQPVAETAIEFPYGGRPGGWSGIDVSPDGRQFWAVSDRALRLSGTFRRNDAGTITRAEISAMDWVPLARPGAPGAMFDAEGLDVRLPDGEVFISFEGRHRLNRYAPRWKQVFVVRSVPLDGLAKNRGFEGLARDAEGALYVVPERAPGTGAGYPLLRLPTGRDVRQEDWKEHARIASAPMWRAVGADFGPDGAYYLLERRFGLFGFASRIRRFPAEALAAGHAPDGGPLRGTLVFQSPLGRYGNLEGLGLWQDDKGVLRAVMIADDNQQSFQRSQIVEVGLGRLSLASGVGEG